MTHQEKLLSAFKQGKIKDFLELLECGDIDVDYFYGEPDNGTLLDLVSRSQCIDYKESYIRPLIQSGAKLWCKDEETGKLKIHEIFNHSDWNLVVNIWYGIYHSSESGSDNANIMKVAVEENDIEAITLLARSYFIVYNESRDSGPGDQHLILLQGSIDAVRLFIKYFDVDKEFQKDSQGHLLSCREIILQKFPELEVELPIRSPSELQQEILFLCLKKGVRESFVKRIAEVSIEILNDARETETKLTYLHVACASNYIEVVDALLKKNVNLNELVSEYEYVHDILQNVTPIMLAALNGSYEVFKKLFSIPDVVLQNEDGSGSVLHLVLRGMQQKQNFNHSTDGHRKILKLLLKYFSDFLYHYKLDINHTDRKNRTALHYALKFNNEFAIKSLLEEGAKLYQKDQSILTSISVSIIESYFDGCISKKDTSITFCYKIFSQLDLYSIATKSKGNFFIRFESVTEMKKLYTHPLTKSFLYLKWRFFRMYYYINLVFYSLFCLALSTYIFQTQHCLPSSASFNGSGSTDAAINRDAPSILCDVSLWMWPITLLLYIILILRELCQFFISIRLYIGVPENWLEVTTIVVIGLLFANDTNTHLAATVILISWIEFILLLGKLPSLSIYIEMFKKVALNFAKFLLLYSILIASFAYSFFILFRNKPSGQALAQNRTDVNTKDEMNENSMKSWQNLQMSFFKSFIMMTNGFDASNLPLDSSFSYGHVFLILFVFLVTMVLYNLLNGLAVSDTRAIMEDAEIISLMSRAKFISQIERLAISNPFRHDFRCRTIEQLEKGYLFLRNKLFCARIRIEEKGKVYVDTTNGNRIRIRFFVRNFGKMPSTIVKQANEILEKRKQSELAKNEISNSLTDSTKNNLSEHQFANELAHQFSEQISGLKLEMDAKIAARDEKLLQNVDQRFDKMMNESLSEKLRDLKLEMDAKIAAHSEKLLQNVDQRFDKNNKLLESVLQAVPKSSKA